MTFQGRLILLITALVTLTVLAITGLQAWTTHAAMSARVEADGRMAAQLLARTATQGRALPREIEDLLGRRLVAEATLTAHLVDALEGAKVNPKTIRAVSDKLRSISESGGPEEIMITDDHGRTYLRSQPGPEITFTPATGAQPGQADFYSLLSRSKKSVVAPAAMDGGRLMKFAGVPGVDKQRIVVVGADMSGLAGVARQTGADGVIDSLLATKQVQAAWLLDHDGRVVERGAVTGQLGGSPLSEESRAAAKAAAASGEIGSRLEDGFLVAYAPIKDLTDRGTGVAVVRLPAQDVGAETARQVKIGLLLGVIALTAGISMAVRFARRQMAPIERLGEAVAAVEAGRFNPFTLNEAMERNDEMGRLARVFRSMALEANAREETLDAQLLMRTAELETTSERLASAEFLIEEEQRAARDVQTSLLPQQLPAGRDSQFHGLLAQGPAVSGDFYDVIELDDRHTILVVAGVSGGGVPAAFLMLLVHGAIREVAAQPGATPASILAGANDRLCAQSPFDGFATAFVALYDRVTGTVRHSSAGNRAPCRVLADGSVEVLADAGGPALGVRRGAPYGEAITLIGADDTLFLCTDGVLKAPNALREPFGEARLAAALQQGRGLAARDRAEVVLRAVEAHAGGLPGDLVCLAVRRLIAADERVA